MEEIETIEAGVMHIKTIQLHVPQMQEGMLWEYCFKLIAEKLDEYKKQIEEKDAIIKRMIESEK